MVFPVAELKFSAITRTAERTHLLVRLYRVDDGGLDTNGNQVYLRTLKRERPFDLQPTVTKAEVVAQARLRLQAWALDEGFNLPDDRLICTL
jgi:predicted acyl esterase